MIKGEVEAAAGDLTLDAFLSPASFWPASWTSGAREGAHIPFVHWLVDVLVPDLIVAVGLNAGDLYFAALDVVMRRQLPARGLAVGVVDRSEATEAGSSFSAVHEERFGAISVRIATRTEAALRLKGGGVGLLLLDAESIPALGEELRSWLSTVAADGVVLVSRTAETPAELFAPFDDWRRFDFTHAGGISLFASQKIEVGPVSDLLDLKAQPAQASAVQSAYAQLGHAVNASASVRRHLSAINRLEASLATRSAALSIARGEAAELQVRLAKIEGEVEREKSSSAEVERLRRVASDRVAESARLSEVAAELQAECTRLRAAHADAITALADLRGAYQALQATKGQLDSAESEIRRLSDLLESEKQERDRLTRLIQDAEAENERQQHDLKGLRDICSAQELGERQFRELTAAQAEAIDSTRRDLAATVARAARYEQEADASNNRIGQLIREQTVMIRRLSDAKATVLEADRRVLTAAAELEAARASGDLGLSMRNRLSIVLPVLASQAADLQSHKSEAALMAARIEELESALRSRASVAPDAGEPSTPEGRSRSLRHRLSRRARAVFGKSPAVPPRPPADLDGDVSVSAVQSDPELLAETPVVGSPVIAAEASDAQPTPDNKERSPPEAVTPAVRIAPQFEGSTPKLAQELAGVSARLSTVEHRYALLTSHIQLEAGRIDYLLAGQEGVLSHVDEFQAARQTSEYRQAFTAAEPLVTICVATMNRSHLLVERCLRSLRAQTYKNIQIVVVGDHCTDDTEFQVSRLRDERITFRNLSERGPYPLPGRDRWCVAGTYAANAAIAMAEGAFITHLDDDDMFTADRIETLVRSAQENDADLLWHPFWSEVYGGGWVELGDGRFTLGQITTSVVFYHRWLGRFGWDPLAFRVDEPGDWNRFRKMKLLRPKLQFVDRPLLYHYREGSQSSFVAQAGERFVA